MQDFMKDRYGVDDLTIGMCGLSLLLVLIALLTKFDPLIWIALIQIAVAGYRVISVNIDARRAENQKFHEFGQKLAQTPFISKIITPFGGEKLSFGRTKRTAQRMLRDRETTLFFRCKGCGSILSVPRGKGRLRVTCPRCGTQVEKQS